MLWLWKDTVKSRKFVKAAMSLNLMIGLGFICLRSYVAVSKYEIGLEDRGKIQNFLLTIMYWGLSIYFFNVSNRFSKLDPSKSPTSCIKIKTGMRLLAIWSFIYFCIAVLQAIFIN